MATVLAARVLVPALADTFIELRDSEDVTQVIIMIILSNQQTISTGSLFKYLCNRILDFAVVRKSISSKVTDQ